jgi:hypothetical protein
VDGVLSRINNYFCDFPLKERHNFIAHLAANYKPSRARIVQLRNPTPAEKACAITSSSSYVRKWRRAQYLEKLSKSGGVLVCEVTGIDGSFDYLCNRY